MAGDTTTIARPYAEAVFDRAKETGQLEAWSRALTLLSSIAGDAAMAEQIANPNVPRRRLAELMLGVGGEALSGEAANLVRLLAENDRLALLPDIAALFESRKVAEQGVRQVHIRSAYALSAADQKALAAALEKRLGGEVALTVEKDTDLIGGVEIRAGDLVIDGSVRGRLQRLANELQL